MYKVYKCILLGDSGVGKSTLLHKERVSKPTIGVDFRFIACPRKDMKVMIWDTAGIEKFRIIIQNYYKNTHMGIFVYDVTNRASFVNIKDWYRTYMEHATPNQCILVANKCDLSPRCVSMDEGMMLAYSLGMTYMERGSSNPEGIFEWIIEQATPEEEKQTCLSKWKIRI